MLGIIVKTKNKAFDWRFYKNVKKMRQHPVGFLAIFSNFFAFSEKLSRILRAQLVEAYAQHLYLHKTDWIFVNSAGLN